MPVTFGETIRRRRVEKLLSQGQVAQKLGITAQQLNNIEHSRQPATDSLVEQLAVILDLDVDLLLLLPQEPSTQPAEGAIKIVCRTEDIHG